MSLPEPSPRERMRAAIAGNLQRIRKVDGYRTDAGLLVTLEPMPVLDDTGQPFVTVVWSRQTRARDAAVVRTHRETTIDVVAKVPARLQHAQEQLDAITADIERAMADRLSTYPDRLQAPQYQQAEPLVVQFGAGWVGVSVTYVTNLPIQ